MLLQKARQRMTAGEGFALATINLAHLVKLRSSPEFRHAYTMQDFVVADGNPIVWLGSLAGTKLDLIAGSDMVIPLARLAAETGAKLALLGSTPAALDGAAEVLVKQIPTLHIVAKLSPPMGFDPNSSAADGLLDEVAASGAGLCFLALGAPKQEILAARGRIRTPAIGFASIGAGLDFLAGTQTRAPKWMRAIAMEWIWRLGTDPTRLAWRYAQCFPILAGHIYAALRHRRKG